MYAPGDFVFLNSLRIDEIVAQKKLFNISDLFLHTNSQCHSCFYLDYFIHSCHPSMIIGTSCHARNVYEFSDKYLRGLIGEPVICGKEIINLPVFELIQNIIKSLKKFKKTDEIKKFLNAFQEFDYLNSNASENRNYYESGGDIGIINTIIDLGEEER